MKEFILIFRHEDGSKVASPEQMQIWMKQTMDWVDGIAAQNKHVASNGLLFDEARVVRHNNVVTNGPFGDIKETIGGYIIVRAETVEEAVEMAKGSPVPHGFMRWQKIKQKIFSAAAKGYFKKTEPSGIFSAPEKD